MKCISGYPEKLTRRTEIKKMNDSLYYSSGAGRNTGEVDGSNGKVRRKKMGRSQPAHPLCQTGHDAKMAGLVMSKD